MTLWSIRSLSILCRERLISRRRAGAKRVARCCCVHTAAIHCRCFNRLGRHEAQVTLNGQQFSTPLGFEVLPHPVWIQSILYRLPSLEVSLSLSMGRFGAFNLTAAGRISNAADDVAVVEATSGDITSSEDGTGEAVSGEAIIENTPLTSTYAQGLLSCRIGEATVPATLLNQSAVTCRTPSRCKWRLCRHNCTLRRAIPRRLKITCRSTATPLSDSVLRLTNALPNQRGRYPCTADASRIKPRAKGRAVLLSSACRLTLPSERGFSLWRSRCTSGRGRTGLQSQ